MTHHHHPDRHGRGSAPRGGWEQWSERLERRFAAMFGDGRSTAPPGGWGRWNARLEERLAETFGNSRGGNGRGGGGGGRRRMFSGDELRLVLLRLIADKARHGYDLIREIEDRTGGAYAPSPGVVYPTLTMLADMDLIVEQPGEGAKKVYGVTPAGEARLSDQAEAVTALFDRLATIAARRSRADSPSVRRAMGNLHQAVHNRIHAEAVDQAEGGAAKTGGETVKHAIADILDDAARRIERL